MTDTRDDAAPLQQNRQSKTARREKFRPLSESEKAPQVALNTLRQYDRMVELINEALRDPQRFRLRPSAIQELNRISIKNLEAEAGRWRDVPIEIEGSKHQPPPAEEVPKHIDDLCEYVTQHWDDRSPFHLAAYVMWRLNWMAPDFDDPWELVETPEGWELRPENLNAAKEPTKPPKPTQTTEG